MWADGPDLNSLSWSTPIVDENFNGLSATSGTAKITSSELTAYGAFNRLYNNNTSNTYAIASNATFDSNVLSLTAGSGSPLIATITGETFGTKGAFSFKVLKTSKCYIGLYANGTDNTAITKTLTSVYLKNEAGAISIADYNSSGKGSTTWQSVGTYTSDIIEICVIYNNTESSDTYGNSVALAAKTAHVYVNGSCVMNGLNPKEFTIPGFDLACFRVTPMPTSGNTAVIDDVKIYDALPIFANYTITKSASNGTISTQVSSSEVTSAAEDATVTIEATPSTGYSFSSWSVTKTSGGAAVSVANASANPTTFTMPAEAVTVAATFTKNSHNLDLTTTNGTCAVTVDDEDWDGSSAIAYGAAVVITATPSSGYLFDAWDHTLASPTISSNVISFSMPDDDVIIEAKYVDASSYYSITVDDDIVGGTISADKNTAAEGATITLTATPSTGYSFSAWTVLDGGDNAVTVSNNQFTMPASDVTVTATFTPIAVTGVSLNKTSASISVGETEALTATVAPANALNKAVTWTSSNTSVATVSNGVVTAVAAGSATITVTTTDGSFTATCAVTVVNAVTFDATKDKGTSPIEKSGVSFECDNGVLNNSSEYRLYKNSETTFSVSTGKITKIEFTGVSGNPASGFASQSGWTTDGNDGTWTGKSSSVSFTASGAQVRATEIKVYYATTATPTFSVATGEYSEAKSVTISCATDGASIYYTTDGTTPTSSSTAYSSAISIVETTTLKAIAIKDGVDSEVASATYTMNRPAAPTFDVDECIFDEAFDLHLASATDGSTIYYTTDGSTPTTSSSVYSTKVAISAATTTVKAIAVKDGLTSDVASATYTYDTRPAPTFTLSTTSVNLKVNETSSAVSLTTNSDGAITFACADAHVTLTGTGSSRTISADAAGVYTVNVSTAATSNYLAGAGTITVTVTKKATTMVLTPSFSSKDLYETTTGSLTGVPQYNSSAVAGAEVTYTSSDTKVATIASDGTVTFKKAGSTTLTASYAGNDEYEECEATYELELIDTTPQSTSVDITFGNSLYGTSYKGTDAADNGPFEGTVNNVTVTVAQGSGANLYITNTETRIYGGTTKGTITITAPTGYVMTKIAITKGTNWSVTASPGTLSSATWTGSASSVVFSASARSDFQSAEVTLAPIVTLPAAIYATRSYKHALDFSGTGIKAYTVKVNAEKSTARLTEIASGKVPANEGVILYAEEAGSYAVPVAASASALDNDLVGVTEATAVPWQTGDKYNYILQRSGSDYAFNKANGATLAANRAYLQTTFNVAAGARLVLVFDDETTGVSDVRSKMEDVRIFFDLQGRRVEKPVKGQLYIVNGKKVVMK